MTGAQLEEAISEKPRLHNAKALKGYKSILTVLGMAASKASLDKVIGALEDDGCKYSRLKPLALELIGRLIDEMKEREFFALTMSEANLFDKPRAGWEAAIGRFPKALGDIEEASKCYALSRYPAAVFHSVQIVESGLIELGKFIGVNDPISGWSAVSSALKRTLDKKWGDLTPFEKKNRPFLEQVQGTVEGLKNAWRNKISHSHGRLILMDKEFNPETAEEILFATRAFMRRLAEGLPKRRQRKVSA